MEARIPIDSEALLEQAGWVRALARKLVADAGLAEDVAQDALVVALRGRPPGTRPLRPWLAAVVRNLSRNARRHAWRRERVETALPDEPALPAKPELVERAATQRALVGVLLRLDEPDRTVLLLRYLEGLSNEDIAERSGVPASTVASRLARAHERLRAKWLARHPGDRLAALAALTHLAEGEAGIGASSASESSHAGVVPSRGRGSAGARGPAALSSAHAGVPIALLSLVALVALGTLARRPAPQPPAQVAARTTAVAPSAGGPARLASVALPAAPHRARAGDGHVDVATGDSDACPYPGSLPVLVHGRVVDLDGRPVAGLELGRVAPYVSLPQELRTWRGALTDDRATSDAEGRFALETIRIGWFVAAAPGWTTVRTSVMGEADDLLVVVAPARVVGGVAVDANGLPLAGVAVRLAVPERRLEGLGPVLHAALPLPHERTTDANGAFRFDDAPAADLVLGAEREGLEALELELPAPARGAPSTHGPDAALRLVLEPSGRPTFTGRVVDASGGPVEGAWVSAGQRMVRSDADGRFLVTLDPAHLHDRADGPVAVRAVHTGRGEHARAEIPLPPAGAPPAELRLVLDGKARAIGGRVLTPDGRPVAGVTVRVVEETPFAWLPEGEWIVRRSVERMLGAHPARTSADGTFRIGGLADREYRLDVLDEPRLTSAVAGPVPAGTRGVVVPLDPDAIAPLAGRVVDAAGEPVPDVRVAVSRRAGWAGPGDFEFSLAVGTSAVTDARGRFALGDVAAEGVFLRLEGEGIVPELERSIDGEGDRGALELVVRRRCTLQVDWGDWSGRADHLHIEAEDGTQLGLVSLRGATFGPLDALSVGTGLSAPVAVPESAVRAVLTRTGSEVLRVPLRLTTGRLVVLEL